MAKQKKGLSSSTTRHGDLPGVIPPVSLQQAPPPLPWPQERSMLPAPIGEAFRQLSQAVHLERAPNGRPIIGVTSGIVGEGKTTVALGLANTLAATGERPVALLEVDFARPALQERLGLSSQQGLAEWVGGEAALTDVLQRVTEHVYVLPAGKVSGDPARLVRGLTRTHLLQCLADTGAVLVLDLPPVLATSYGVLAASLADTLLLVVRAGYTTETMVKEVQGRLEGSALCGIVLNTFPSIPLWLREREPPLHQRPLAWLTKWHARKRR